MNLLMLKYITILFKYFLHSGSAYKNYRINFKLYFIICPKILKYLSDTYVFFAFKFPFGIRKNNLN